VEEELDLHFALVASELGEAAREGGGVERSRMGRVHGDLQ